MNPRQFHLFEKIQVQLATAIALAAVYFLLWPGVRPDNPALPLVFLPNGAYPQLLLTAVAIWALAAVFALATIHGRSEGPLLAVLLGAGGLCLRTEPITNMLWLYQDRLGALYGQLLLELIALGGILLGAALVVALVRLAVAALRPRWVYRDIRQRLSHDQQKILADAPRFASLEEMLLGLRMVDLRSVRQMFDPGVTTADKRNRKGRLKLVTESLAFVGMSLVLSLVLIWLLLQSENRGQILFALLAGFGIAVLAAHQVFPSPYSILAWFMPIIAGVLLYAFAAATTSVGTGPQDWMHVRLYARVLPIDYFAAGCGGAVLGFWVSTRLHELRQMEKLQDTGD